MIFDRNGNELALSVPSTTIFADQGATARRGPYVSRARPLSSSGPRMQGAPSVMIGFRARWMRRPTSYLFTGLAGSPSAPVALPKRISAHGGQRSFSSGPVDLLSA